VIRQIIPYSENSPRNLHHNGLCPSDFERSLSFYRDGIGLSILVDEVFDGDFKTLFGIESNKIRSVLLGDPRYPDTGIIELIQFIDGGKKGANSELNVYFWLSFWVDVNAVIERIGKLGLVRDLRQVEMPGASVATLLDPDGIRVELIPNSIH